MGSNARADIWVGIKFDGFFDRSEFVDFLDTTQMSEDERYEILNGRPGAQGAGTMVGEDVYDTFTCCDDMKGFGVKLLWHDWDFEPKVLDFSQLAKQTEALKKRVSQVFQKWGIQEEPHAYLHTDYR